MFGVKRKPRRSSIIVLICAVFIAIVTDSKSVANEFSSRQYEPLPSYVPQLGSGRQLFIQSLLDFLEFAGVRDYQIGDEWGKKSLDPQRMSEPGSAYARTVQATGFFNSATAFYLGRFAGEHVMATNHHVLPSNSECIGKTVNFTYRKKKYRCRAMIGSWPEIDLALFTIEGGESANQDLTPFARNFDFTSAVSSNMPLLTVGFGIADNPGRQMMVNENKDCRVISGQNEFRLMADPDRYNPAEYKAWSFSTGCSVSHGDSGSPLVNRTNGAVIGLLWTGAIPKESRVQSSAFLATMQSRGDEDIWTLLTYVVPAIKIKETLSGLLDAGQIQSQYVALLRDMLKAQ